jgi:hypothetical protein
MHVKLLVIQAFVFSFVSANSACKTESPGQAQAIDSLREEARIVLEDNCGQCHQGTYPTALPRALAIFDLSDSDWSARMSKEQLRNASFRLTQPLPPDGEDNRSTARDRELFTRFVEMELARRSSTGPSPRSTDKT